MKFLTRPQISLENFKDSMNSEQLIYLILADIKEKENIKKYWSFFNEAKNF